MATYLRGERRGRKGRIERTDKGYVYRCTRTYVVVSDTKTETELAVVSTPGIPVVGFTFTTDGALCKSVDPQQDSKSPYVWIVTAEFDTEPFNQDSSSDDENNPDPTTWVPIYRGKVGYYEEVVYEDFSDPPKKYVNSAGCKFPEPLKIWKPLIIYDFSQYEVASTTDKEIGQRVGKINKSDFKDYTKETLLIADASFERGFFYGIQCVRIDYQVVFKEEGWYDRPIDCGYEFKKTAGGPVQASSCGRVVFLNIDGTRRLESLGPLAELFKPHKPVEFSFLR